MTIMYIDDDAEDREFFSEAVRSIDPYLMCYMFKDGAEGLRNLQEMIVMPDYIFVDVNMPVMNGRQFLSEIKKYPTLRSIPVIMYSTTSYPEEISEYVRMGAQQVLVKPNSLEKIEALVKSVLYDRAPYGDHLIRVSDN